MILISPFSTMSSTPPATSNRPVTQSSKCRICDDRYTSAKIPVSLPCGHVVCNECEQGVSRTGNTLCPFCRRRYHSTDVRRIYNDAEAQSEIEQLNEVADRIRVMMNDQQQVRNEAEELRRQNAALQTERDQLAVQTGMGNLSVVQSGQGSICSNCTKLTADYNKLAKQYKILQDKNKLLASRVLVADVSSDSDSD